MREKCTQIVDGSAVCQRPEHGYTLYGLVVHRGSTLSFGHYYAYVRVPWTKVNRNIRIVSGQDNPEPTVALSREKWAKATDGCEPLATTYEDWLRETEREPVAAEAVADCCSAGSSEGVWMLCDDRSVTEIGDDSAMAGRLDSQRDSDSSYLLLYANDRFLRQLDEAEADLGT